MDRYALSDGFGARSQARHTGGALAVAQHACDDIGGRSWGEDDERNPLETGIMERELKRIKKRSSVFNSGQRRYTRAPDHRVR
jgi:hypothetical protein